MGRGDGGDMEVAIADDAMSFIPLSGIEVLLIDSLYGIPPMASIRQWDEVK